MGKCPAEWIKVRSERASCHRLCSWIRVAIYGYSFGANIPIYQEIHLSVNYRNYSDWIVERKNIYSSGVFGIGLYYEHKPKKK